ncbi:MAG: hypothetical protein LBC87_05175 [Fibromonadaceae bacterium]|jgi:Tfp pilus assembly protein PilV|nr:hypothetical protein [Fibromonadaceae bacterium]
MKKGFGILEVLIAAVVLGFLIIGLNKLQLGNREALLRVRERDAASFIAQHVLDSLGAVGINSIEEKQKDKCGNKMLVHCNPDYTYYFGNDKEGISAPVSYRVEVELLTTSFKQEDNTKFEKLENIYAKSLKATVLWKYKGQDQSIQVAKVVR